MRQVTALQTALERSSIPALDGIRGCCKMGFRLAETVLCAAASDALIEKPALRLKRSPNEGRPAWLATTRGASR